MVSVTVLCVGKLKERYLTDACGEYTKRLSRFCKINVAEIAEGRLSDSPNAREIETVLEKEGDGILSKIPGGSYVFALCIEGKQMASQKLAECMDEQSVGGHHHFVFIIGGSHGLADKVKKAAQKRLSMSEMTFPHQLARVLLLEQIYRAFTIQNHMPYHK